MSYKNIEISVSADEFKDQEKLTKRLSILYRDQEFAEGLSNAIFSNIDNIDPKALKHGATMKVREVSESQFKDLNDSKKIPLIIGLWLWVKAFFKALKWYVTEGYKGDGK